MSIALKYISPLNVKQKNTLDRKDVIQKQKIGNYCASVQYMCTLSTLQKPLGLTKELKLPFGHYSATKIALHIAALNLKYFATNCRNV